MKTLKSSLLYALSFYFLAALTFPCYAKSYAKSYAKPAKEVFPSWYTTNVRGNTVRLAYVSNHPLDISSKEIDRIIVLIHGAGRSKITHDRVLDFAQDHKLANKTMIFQPQFLTAEDIAKFNLPNDVLYWHGGWREGDRSRNRIGNDNRPSGISSFAIVNKIVKQLVVNNPNVHKVIIAGHSAGGQYAQRFAAGSQLEQELAFSGVNVRYVSANPSSFVYLDNRRVVPGTLNRFVVPSQSVQKDCPNYNKYKFGMENLNHFMRKAGIKSIHKQFPLRDVRYLQGADDNDPEHQSLGKLCASMLQGAQRLERGIIFYNYLQELFGSDIQRRHTQAILQGVGHRSVIFITPCGASFLFDVGGCNVTTPGNLTAVIKQNKSALLKWVDHAEGEAGYKVERSLDGGNTFRQIALLKENQSSYIDEQTNASSSYHYRVRAYVNDGSNSGFSNTAKVYTIGKNKNSEK